MEDTLRIAVCDDEKNIRAYLVSLIKKQNKECSIMEYASAEEFLSDEKEYDLIYLDIELGGTGTEREESGTGGYDHGSVGDNAGTGREAPDRSMDGMELSRRIRGMNPQGNSFPCSFAPGNFAVDNPAAGKIARNQPIIIFVTGHEKYVFDAFDVGAFQYLVKPLKEQKFAEVFERAAKQLESAAQQCRKELVIRYAGEKKAIPFHDIYYMESQNHTIVMHLKSGRLEYYGKIADLEEELAGQFYRIHRGYLINLFYVEGYDRTEVRMANEDKLLISRYKYDGFIQAYMDYLSEANL